ncbi:MAG: hypothetical protein ABW352_19000 [Polyangiales bacterium]
MSASLGFVGCGDDSDGDEPVPTTDAAVDANRPIDSGARPDTGAPPAGDAGGAPQACIDEVYEELDSQCKTCICATSAETAPVCDGACWAFLACAAKANAGPCGQFAQGTQQNGECVGMQCGQQLSAPGVSPAASAYGNAGIGRACFASACAASLGAINARN